MNIICTSVCGGGVEGLMGTGAEGMNKSWKASPLIKYARVHARVCVCVCAFGGTCVDSGGDTF